MIRWKIRLPLPVNARRTIGWPVVRVEVGLRTGRLQLCAGHLRDPLLLVRVRRVVLEQVVDGLPDRGVAGRARVVLGRRARDHRGAGRDGEDLPALRHSRNARVEQPLTRVRRPCDQPLVLVEEVVGGRCALFRLRLLAREQVVEAGGRDGDSRESGGRDRGTGEIALEVVELELRGLADQLRGLCGVFHARQLDHDLVVALLADLRLGDAELVHAAPHDRDGVVETLLRDLLSLRRYGLEHHLEAALQIEAEARLLVRRRPRDSQQGHTDDRGHDQADEDQMVTACVHGGSA